MRPISLILEIDSQTDSHSIQIKYTIEGVSMILVPKTSSISKGKAEGKLDLVKGKPESY